ncbi:hypothetical protein SAMD00020551_3794 [Mesobacillus selenatarsenatis SF-1]|uniref:Uncharacterized protein n=1 Tax=Mesobacillus selenatarsenatis (strain DSM 18680 / JCM 14380 / FERM P-15431 / SF-1) TaxID=1321606 RepID=A0A0A8X9D1_MESS1|nr:hypothetical protein SAMD00020551_3794 [Mesobacillus selenatarsenatis SF-1]
MSILPLHDREKKRYVMADRNRAKEAILVRHQGHDGEKWNK